jgi:hypothetical protein
MRAIIRFSIDNENNSALRNKLQAVLRKHGFSNKKSTATYSGKGPKNDAKKLADALHAFWMKLYNHPAHGPGKLDHFWMYVERQRRSAKKTTRRRVARTKAKNSRLKAKKDSK